MNKISLLTMVVFIISSNFLSMYASVKPTLKTRRLTRTLRIKALGDLKKLQNIMQQNYANRSALDQQNVLKIIEVLDSLRSVVYHLESTQAPTWGQYIGSFFGIGQKPKKPKNPNKQVSSENEAMFLKLKQKVNPIYKATED